jgi:hypothetical protein
MTWYARMLPKSSVLRLATTSAIFSNAELRGAKMVRSGVSFTRERVLVVVSASARVVRLAAVAVSATEAGIVRTRSTTWMTPPVKLTS